MERADFIYQIFVEKIHIDGFRADEITISYKLFSLPSVEIDNLHITKGEVEVNKGKRMVLKIPQIEVVGQCPLEISLRSPKQGHTSVRLASERVSLQNCFEQSLQNPNRYVHQSFSKCFHGKRDGELATLYFKVSLCYTSSTMEEQFDKKPISLADEEDENARKNIVTPKPARPRPVNNRAPLIPDIPETRKRSIFYFDKRDLLEENKVLTDEISQLTNLISNLQKVIEQHEAPVPIANKGKNIRKRNQTGLIYRSHEISNQ